MDRLVQVQRARVRPEPELPRLLQAEQQAVAARDGGRQGVDRKDPVRPLGQHPRRRARRQLPLRQHAQLHIQVQPLSGIFILFTVHIVLQFLQRKLLINADLCYDNRVKLGALK